MKCWWCEDNLPNTAELIKNHCKEKHNVTEYNNIIMQKACMLMQNKKLLQRFKNCNAKPCYICGQLVKNQWMFINHCLIQHVGIGVQRGGGFAANIVSELPVRIILTQGDLFDRYELVAKKEDFPTAYGWGVSGSISSFLRVATQELNSLLLDKKLASDKSLLNVDSLKITFSAVIQNQQELGFGIEHETLPSRRWYAQTVESIGMLPEVREYLNNSIKSRILYNAETGSSVHFQTFLEFRMDVVDVADTTISNVFGGNEDALVKMLVNYPSSSDDDDIHVITHKRSSSDDDDDDDIHFIPRKRRKTSVSIDIKLVKYYKIQKRLFLPVFKN